jgi:hypothetical protein
VSDCSGRFVLRVSPALHRRLRDCARGDGVSLNALCVRLLDAGLSLGSGGSARAAAGLDPGLLDAVAREWAGELVGVAFFGSAARGEATETSDIDLLVVLEPGTRIERSLYDRWDGILRSRGRPADDRVSPQFVALPPSPEDAGGIWLEVAREGIVLFDREAGLARFLIALRDLVAEGGVTRRKVHGHPYWVREGRRR